MGYESLTGEQFDTTSDFGNRDYTFEEDLRKSLADFATLDGPTFEELIVEDFEDFDPMESIVDDDTSAVYLAAKKILVDGNYSFEACMYAIRIDPYIIKEIPEQRMIMCHYAVSLDGMALKYVRNQTPMICETAVRRNGMALQYVKEQNLVVCMMAIRSVPDAFQYADKTMYSEGHFLSNFASVFFANSVSDIWPESAKAMAVYNNPDIIKSLESPSEELKVLSRLAQPVYERLHKYQMRCLDKRAEDQPLGKMSSF